MVPAGNEAKRLSLANHTTKTIHHHYSSSYNKNFRISGQQIYFSKQVKYLYINRKFKYQKIINIWFYSGQYLKTILIKNFINHSFQHNSFPQELSEVIHLYKKLDSLQKENYRPASLLPHTSRIFERIIHKQITNYMRDKLNKSITFLRKSHGMQHSLAVMLEKWKRAIHKGECVSVLLMDLSKSFNTINYELMIAKLKAYGFSGEPLKFMQSYLKKQKPKSPD